MAFVEWCAGRVPFMQRKYAPQLCASLNISLDDSPNVLADIALTYHCSTLKDAWWVSLASLFGKQLQINTPLPNWGDLTIGGFSRRCFRNSD